MDGSHFSDDFWYYYGQEDPHRNDDWDWDWDTNQYDPEVSKENPNPEQTTFERCLNTLASTDFKGTFERGLDTLARTDFKGIFERAFCSYKK